jgi:hypothetical protein
VQGDNAASATRTGIDCRQSGFGGGACSELGSVSYAASKGGIVALTKSLAMTCAPNVRVNAISPGSVDTPLIRDRNQGKIPEGTAACCAQRIAQPEEIADAILFLTGSESSFVRARRSQLVEAGRFIGRRAIRPGPLPDIADCFPVFDHDFPVRLCREFAQSWFIPKALSALTCHWQGQIG